MAPGEYLVQLTVRDSLQNTVIETRNIRVENTNPVLDDQSLVVTPPELTSGVLVTIEVSVKLSDPDGTTQDVRATIVHDLQVWDFVLQDLDGDDVWEGSVEVNPEKPGRPSLRITATDGTGESATIDQISRTIVVIEADETNSNLSLIFGGGAVILLLILSSIVVAKIRRNRLEDDLIQSWDVLSKPNIGKDYPELDRESSEETKEAVNDLWSQLEQEEGLN